MDCRRTALGLAAVSLNIVGCGAAVDDDWSDAVFAFVRRGDPGRDVWIAALDGGNPRRITSVDSWAPAWSPTGELISYFQRGAAHVSPYSRSVAIGDPGGERSLAEVESVALGMVWDPDASRIHLRYDEYLPHGVWSEDSHLGTVDVDTGDLTTAFRGGAQLDKFRVHPRTGELLITIFEREEGTGEVIEQPRSMRIYDPRSGTQTVVPPIVPGAAMDCPAWHPTNRRIYFCTEEDGNLDIYSRDAEGGNLRSVAAGPTSETDPEWSPDGEVLMYTRACGDGCSESVFQDTDGEELASLHEVTGPWADSRHVFDVRAPPGGESIIWLVDPFTGQETELVAGASPARR